MIGQTLSHYRILEKLGEGGMGVVYKAEDTKLKRTVALKFLPREAVAEPSAKARLLHEAQAAAALDHQNICTIHEIEETDGHTFIVMAFVEGESLKERIAAGPLALKDVLDIAKQTAKGLARAHKKGIIHRDIKSANLMLSEVGQIKIMDFGLARTQGQTKLTKTGVSMGTVTYMSPEQASGAKVDHRTDIWSFGVLLYEMIAGRLPFRGEHEQAVLYSVLNEDPESLTAIRTGVPLELERMVNKAMAKHPDDRYQHIDDMLVDLNAIERQLAAPDTVKRVSGRLRTTPAGGRNRRTHMRVIVGAAFVVVVIAVVAFVLSQRGKGIPGRTVEGGVDAKIQSLAVLPFDNLMNDPEQDYFVDGMHDALITGLSKLGSLRVISRTTVMRYKSSEKPMPEIARELDVDALIEGSVLRVGDEVRITAQLIEGHSDQHLWADSYDRDVRNVLTLLNEVAGAIAAEIQAVLTPEQAERLARARPVDPDAYEAFLRGSQLFYTFTWRNVRESIAFFDKAIEIDSAFAEAYAGKSSAYMVLTVMGEQPVEVMPLAREAAQKALELNDGLSGAHTAMGYVQMYFERNWEAGGAAFRKALEIDPNDAMAHHGYADYLMILDRMDESVEEVIRGRKSDPLSPLTNAVVVGHLYAARRYEEAVAEAKKLLAIDPHYPAVRGFLRRAYWQMGKFEESIELLRESNWRKESGNKEALESGYAEGGPRGAMLAIARHLASKSDSAYVDPLSIAVYYAQAGETQIAMNWLKKAEEARSPTFVHTLMDPCFDPIRNTPHFKALRQRLNLPG